MAANLTMFTDNNIAKLAAMTQDGFSSLVDWSIDGHWVNLTFQTNSREGLAQGRFHLSWVTGAPATELESS